MARTKPARLTGREKKILKAAAGPSMEEIAQHKEDAGDADLPQFVKFFEIIECDIFLSTFRITKARELAGLADNNYSTRFREITGQNPADYIRHHKLTTARRILVYFGVKVVRTAAMVGYEQAYLTKIYQRMFGVKPSEENVKLHEGDPDKFLLPEEEGHSGLAAKLDPRLSLDTTELQVGEPANLGNFWDAIKDKGFADIKDYIRENSSAITVSHFHLLCVKSKYEGRKNRGRGVELARAALGALKIAEFNADKSIRNQTALGYAYLANAHCLLLQTDEAGKCFAEACSFLPEDREKYAFLHAQVHFLRVYFLWYQGNTDAALRLLHDVLPDIREHGSSQLLARALVCGADIYEASGHPRRAMPLLSEAIEVEAEIDDPYVVFSAHFCLTHIYATTGQGSDAAAGFRKLRALYAEVDSPVLSPHMSYLEGAIYIASSKFKKAKALLLKAREGFLNQDLHMFAALVSLHLSLVYLELDSPGQAFEEAMGMLPTVEQYSTHHEVIAALAILKESQEKETVSRLELKGALHHLDLARKDPSYDFSQRSGHV